MRVLLRGPFLTMSGYGVHARQYARWFISRGFDVSFDVLRWGSTTWMIDPSAEEGLIGEIMSRSACEGTFDLSIQIQLPNEWDPKLAKKNIGITAGVETTICNSQWIDACNLMDVVIVPSTFVRDVFTNTGNVKTNIVVIPESFPDTFAGVPEESAITLQHDFNVLIVGQLTGRTPSTDRKNLFFTIKWLNELFSDDPNVCIVLKTNLGRNSLIDLTVIKQIMNQIMLETRKGAFPKYKVIHGIMNDREMHSLYSHKMINAFISLTHGEGFGLPLLEAAVCGVPVIATNWSGHLDFMNKGRFIKIEHELHVVPDEKIDGKIFVPGAQWADPNESDFKTKMAKFRKSFSTPREWAVDLKKKLITEYSHAHIYSSSLDELISGVV